MFSRILAEKAGHHKSRRCRLMGWSGRAPAPPATNLARGSKDKGAASGCLTCSRKSPDGVIGTLKFLCPSEGRNGARIANSNSRSECLVTGAEFVGTYCTKATPPSRLIVYARSWYRVQIWRALRLTEILTNSETPSELTLASNAPNVSRQNPLHLQMLPPAAVSGGTFRALSCPA